MPIVDNELLDQLEDGPLHRFADFLTLGGVIPASGAGVYTIWDDEGGLVYAGVAGRNPAGTGLSSRLRSHASGRRSGDQFCVYVADHYVLPSLTREQIEAISDSRLSMDALVRENIHVLGPAGAVVRVSPSSSGRGGLPWAAPFSALYGSTVSRPSAIRSPQFKASKSSLRA